MRRDMTGFSQRSKGFLLAYSAVNKGQARLYTAMNGRDPVAAMLVLQHGNMATYQAGFSDDAGRKRCAHNLILWQVMCDMQRKGVRHLDLGRADLSEGLRRFKSGAGARLEILAGTFWVRGRWRKQGERRAPDEMTIRDAA